MILVLGSGRSGTTLLAKLLDSQPNVLYRHEPDSIQPNSDIPFLPTRENVRLYIDMTKSYLSDLERARYIKSSTHTPIFPKSYRNAVQQLAHLWLNYAMKALGASCNARVVHEKFLVPDFISNMRKDGIIYVIKSVSSLNRAYLFICSEPNAKIVHIVRHPCGVASSLIRGIREGAMKKRIFLDAIKNMGESKNFPISTEDMKGSSIEEQIAYQWSIFNDKVFDELIQSNRYRLIRYEDLCLNMTETVIDLFIFCGVSFTDQSRRFVGMLEGQQPGNRRYFSVVRAPKEAATKWRNELSASQIERVNSIACHSRIGSMYLDSEY